ncbi:MAG: GNAT family N-acetyltransferase [Spirochaetales bacterium]|nr:GNAT family N-acetyltransferase [Spirochaetales bacterium]
MEIIDLEERYEQTYCKCLEDWSDEFDDAGDLKKKWLARKKTQGLRVKLARNEKDEIVGMIHYVPIEHSWAKGVNLYLIYCVWVHGYKEGVGNNQGSGIGTLLLEAAEADCMELGADGLAAWGVRLPFFLRSKWYKKRGYKVADTDGMLELVWKPFKVDVMPPELIKRKKKPPAKNELPTVTCFRNGWCPAQNISCERAKRAASELGDRVRFIEYDTDNPEVFEEWGIADAVFIEDKCITNGPPLTDAKVKKQLDRALRRHRR